MGQCVKCELLIKAITMKHVVPDRVDNEASFHEEISYGHCNDQEAMVTSLHMVNQNNVNKGRLRANMKPNCLRD